MAAVLLRLSEPLVGILLATLSDGRSPAWSTATLALLALGYAWIAMLGSASLRPHRFQGRHRRRAG